VKHYLSFVLLIPALLGAQNLMPDASFKGWTRIAIPPDKPVDPVTQWKVDPEHNLLICEGNRGHEWLRWDRELADFILHVEWRFPVIEGGKGYNSGIFVRNDMTGAVWHQAQTGSASGGWLFGVTPGNGTPQRFNLRQEIKGDRVKEAGEWNTYDIRCEGRKIALSVNGAVTSEFTQCDVPKGYIGLEAEGYRIEFRNIRVEPLR
jgi:hypothetical protein